MSDDWNQQDEPPRRSVFGDDDEELPGDDAPPLPHWTEPATGESIAAVPDDDLDAWSSLSVPRWRDDATDYDEDYATASALPGDGGVGGASVFAEGAELGDPGGPDPSRIGPVPIVNIETPAAPDPVPAPVAPERVSRAAGPSPTVEAEPAGDRSLPVAIGAAAIMAAVAVICFVLGKAATAALIAVALVLAAAEFYNSVRRVGYQPATLVGLAAVGALPLAVYWRGAPAQPLVVALALAAGFLWYLVGVGDERPTPNLAVTMLGVLWIGFFGSYAALMLEYDKGISMLVSAVIVTAAYDTGAYFIGRSAGRTPLSVASPNKTMEGLVGGVIMAILASVIIVGLGDIEPFGAGLGGTFEAIVLGIVVGVVAPVGDLAESLLKRDLGIKDMGSMIPGHGGVLDRFDSLLFVLPAVYYTAVLLF